MGVTVVECGPERVVLRAALEPNVNHVDSAFGGSVASLATLAGWAVVHLWLYEAGIQASTVIQRSSIEYHAPAMGPFDARSDRPGEPAWGRLHRGLDRFGRGRIHLGSTVRTHEGPVATFRGAFVALVG